MLAHVQAKRWQLSFLRDNDSLNQAATHRECKASLDKHRRDMCGVSANYGSWMAPEVYLYVNVSSSESSLVGVVRGKDLCPRTTRLSYDMCAISRHIGLASVRHAIPLPTMVFPLSVFWSACERDYQVSAFGEAKGAIANAAHVGRLGSVPPKLDPPRVVFALRASCELSWTVQV